MGMTTGLIIGLGIAGGLGGVTMCTQPKYQIGECVRSVDSFGDYNSDFIRKIININGGDYKFITYSPDYGWLFTSTASISVINEYYVKVDCP